MAAEAGGEPQGVRTSRRAASELDDVRGLRPAGAARRGHQAGRAAGQSRLLFDIHHSRAGAVDSCRIRGPAARHHLRLQVRCIRGREAAHDEDALRGSGRRLLRLQRLWAPAHGRDAGAARTRRRLAAIHAAPAADSARHPVHHLREAGEAGDRRRAGAGAARVLRRQAVGARLWRGASAADQVFA